MTHEIVWTWNGGGVDATAECNDQSCLSRYVCDHPCESYPDVRRDGPVVSHGGYDDTAATPRHTMHNSGECHFVLFLKAERGLLPELNADDQPSFTIGRTVIESVWQDDGALWRVSKRTDVRP